LLAESKERERDLAAPLRGVLDLPHEGEVVGVRGAFFDPGEKELRVAEDPGQRVVDLVRHPCTELADRGELLRLDQAGVGGF
jgi:hypothetical protein